MCRGMPVGLSHVSGAGLRSCLQRPRESNECTGMLCLVGWRKSLPLCGALGEGLVYDVQPRA